jgi:hypothetical protein
MIQIPITEEAFDAIAASLPSGWIAEAPQRLRDGRPAIWLPEALLAHLKALRGPGEDYSDVIIAIARGEAGYWESNP